MSIPLKKTLAAAALVAAAGAAQAASYDFNGSLSHDNSFAAIAFSVASPVGSIVLWTDSAAASFDPVLQLWAMSSASTGTLIAEIDDGDGTLPGQAAFDATITLPVLVPGSYLITLTVSGNFASASGLFQSGFSDTTADLLPSGANTYSAHLSVAGSGVTITPVPEPATWATLLLGIAGLGLARRRA